MIQEQLWSLWRPEGADLPYLSNGGNEFPYILLIIGDIIRVQPPGEQATRKNFYQSRQLNNPFLGTRFETAPVTDVLFRPEEVHGTSAIGKIFEPFPKRYGCVPYQTFRLSSLYETIFHLHSDG